MRTKVLPETLDDLLEQHGGTGTYDDIADRAGISRKALWKLRRGLVGVPQRQTLVGLSAALGGLQVARVKAAIAASQ